MRHPRASRFSGGFTMAELLTVVVIIGIMAAIVIPQAVSGSDVQALSGARMIAADLEYARDLSISLAKPITVTFDTAAESYNLTNASQAIIHPITKASTYAVNFKTTSGFSDADILTANFGGLSTVTFDETGAPDRNGQVTLQVKSHLYTIAVSPSTGKVTVTGS